MGAGSSKSTDPRVEQLLKDIKAAKALKPVTAEQHLRKQELILRLQSQLSDIVNKTINRVTAPGAPNAEVDELMNRARAMSVLRLQSRMPTVPTSAVTAKRGGTRKNNRKNRKTRRAARRV